MLKLKFKDFQSLCCLTLCGIRSAPRDNHAICDDRTSTRLHPSSQARNLATSTVPSLLPTSHTSLTPSTPPTTATSKSSTSQPDSSTRVSAASNRCSHSSSHSPRSPHDSHRTPSPRRFWRGRRRRVHSCLLPVKGDGGGWRGGRCRRRG
jgi:hypothetical protein